MPLEFCQDQNTPDPKLNVDPIPPYCKGEDEPISHLDKSSKSQRDVPLIEDIDKLKSGLGFSANCDPMQSGQIFENPNNPNEDKGVIYRYSRALRGHDEAMLDLFNDIYVKDDYNQTHKVPIVRATPEKAVAYVLQQNVRKDNSLVVDRIRLPIMAMSTTDYTLNQNRYVYHKAEDFFRRFDNNLKPGLTFAEKGRPRSVAFGVARGIPIDIKYQLNVWTLYMEDMLQIIEQIMLKFSPKAYIRVQGVRFEIMVSLDAITSNLVSEPGDKNIRVIKFNFGLGVESFIPQPLIRKKTVLSTVIQSSLDGNVVNESVIESLDIGEQDKC